MKRMENNGKQVNHYGTSYSRVPIGTINSNNSQSQNTDIQYH